MSRNRIAILAVLVGLGLVPAAVASAGAHAFGGRGGCHGSEPTTVEEVREKMGFAAGFVLVRVDATPDQEARVDAILDGFAPEAFAHKQEAGALREEAHAILSADTIDRKALEDVRRDAIALADEGSRKLVETVADLAEVLTAEQRAELVTLHEKMRAGW